MSKKVKEIGVDRSQENKVVLDNYFKMDLGTYEVLKRNILGGVNTMLIGPTGTGKTEVVANMAKALGLPMTVFDMGTMTDPITGLIGTHVISVKDGQTSSEFKKSRFSEVVQQPGIVLLDEISRASATANNILFPVLDFRRELNMEYAFGESDPIKIHPDCVFISTANIGSQYTGTHKLDRALIDRFMLIEVDQLGKEDTIDAISRSFPKLEKEDVNKIVNIYTEINKMHEEFVVPFNLSIRHLKTISSMVSDDFTIYDSYYMLIKGLGSKEGLKAIKSVLESEA